MYIDKPNDSLATFTAELGIPATKLKAASMLVANEYQGIVEQALREAKTELYHNSDYYNKLKDALKLKIISVIKKSIESKLDSAIYDICNSSYMKNAIADAFKSISIENEYDN